MKNITVFCSAAELPDKYTKPAMEFARLMAQSGYNLVFGGSNKGLMKQIADTVAENGGKVIGISLELFKDVARANADEMIIEKTLGARKATMLLRADAIVALVGGVGTLDEVTEIIELRKQKHHEKPIVILNTENFYEGLKMQLEKMENDGFLPTKLNNLVLFAETPSEAIEYLNKTI